MLRSRLHIALAGLLGVGCVGEPEEISVRQLPIIECNSTTLGMPCDSDDTLCTEELCELVGADVECVLQSTAADGTLCESDGDPCSADTCVDGACGHTQLPAGTGCNDGDLCTLGTTCTVAGVCTGGTALDCSDGNACTDDVCDPVSGCDNPPFSEAVSCDDGLFCTTADHCDGVGGCVGEPNCIDGNACTDDACDELGSACINTVLEGEPCNDGNTCTSPDECDAVGACAGTPVAEGTPCTSAGGCELAGTCTAGVCGGTTTAPDGTVCDDGNACTNTDECTGGACDGVTKKCVDSDECTVDGCDPATGCVFPELEGCGDVPDAGPGASDAAASGDAGVVEVDAAVPDELDGGFFGEVGGGGGCGCRAAGDGTGTGVGALLLAAVCILATRRRWPTVLALAFALIGVSRPAVGEGFDVEVFKPAVSSSGFFSQDGAGVLDHGAFNFGVTLDLSSDLLVVRDPDSDEVLMNGTLVSDRLAVHLAGAIGLKGFAELGLRVPVTVSQDGDVERVRPGEQLTGSAFGDVQASAKVRLFRSGGLRLAVAGVLWLPTGAADDFTGGETVAFEPRVIGGLDVGRVSLAVNAGYRLRGKSQIGDLIVDDEIATGAAVAVELMARRLWLLGEGFAVVGVQGNGGEAEQPAEIIAGARYAITGPWMVQAGVGFGVTRGYGAAAARGVVSVAYAPRKSRRPPPPKPLPPVVAKKPEPEPDPEPPPPKDSDGDGLLDPDDGCPDQPEDKDEFEDDDGCPDVDNDGDGILDADDQCPLEAEVVNGVDDEDGCPDKGVIEVKEDKIVLPERVLFDVNRARVKRKGRKVLKVLVDLWGQHPEWQRMTIEGHTDDRGPDEYNEWLSQKRAANVRKELIKLGVAADKLEAKGYGKTRPVATGSSDSAHEKNRRVEFLIIKHPAADD